LGIGLSAAPNSPWNSHHASRHSRGLLRHLLFKILRHLIFKMTTHDTPRRPTPRDL
jgi:hypothetical protein